MNRRTPLFRNLISAGICILVLTLFVSFVAASDSAPDWTLETSDGGIVSFQEQLSKGPVVVSFWATWCKPCVREMPHLNRMAATYADQVSFLAINTDNSKSVAKVAPMLQSSNYTNLIVPLDTSGKVQQQLQVGGIVPFLILFDEQGQEFYRHIGYKEGDEKELEHKIQELLAREPVVAQTGTTAAGQWTEAVSATNKFKYSYSTDTNKEIMDNWLDIGYKFGGFRTGIMLRSQAPSEEGDRLNKIEHRFFEFASSGIDVRAGHFYGLFGRGMVFNAFEDRVVRIDTRLDGITASIRRGNVAATAFSGSPSARELDIRGLDAEYSWEHNLKMGFSGLTYQPDDFEDDAGKIHREWVASARVRQQVSFGDYYFEYGMKKGYEFDPLSDGYDKGYALYANVNLYHGPFSLSWEKSDYDKFIVVSAADGKTPLNRPPSLVSEYTWTLMNRTPHNTNANDERGNNLDLTYNDKQGWKLVASGAQIKDHAGEMVYELAFGSIQKDNVGPMRITGGFGYQDSENIRQTAVGEVTWKISETRSLTMQAEHQHVRLGGGYGYNLGTYDQQWYKLEYETAPSWAFSLFLETNSKYVEQRPADEKSGPFPAAQISYTLPAGGNLNLWAGKRQAGYLCSGGVCKYEPNFTGVEFYGLLRY